MNIRPRSNDDQDQYESPFNMVNEYKSAYVTGKVFYKNIQSEHGVLVFGDDEEMISISLTLGNGCNRTGNLCRSGLNFIF